MDIQVVQNEKPKLRYPKMVCDEPLAPKLDRYPLFQLMNNSFAAALFGIAGSGKTSLAAAMLSTPSLFQHVFHMVIVFIPESSRNSIEDSVFSKLPPDRIYDQLNEANLREVKERVRLLAKQKPRKKALIIIDDQQQYYEEVEETLLGMIANRRHQNLSWLLLGQSYKKLPKKIRMALTDNFIFTVSKEDFDAIFDEHIRKTKNEWKSLTNYYENEVDAEYALAAEENRPVNKSFFYFNTASNRTFHNFNELIVSAQQKKKRQREDDEINEPPVKAPRKPPTATQPK